MTSSNESISAMHKNMTNVESEDKDAKSEQILSMMKNFKNGMKSKLEQMDWRCESTGSSVIYKEHKLQGNVNCLYKKMDNKVHMMSEDLGKLLTEWRED